MKHVIVIIQIMAFQAFQKKRLTGFTFWGAKINPGGLKIHNRALTSNMRRYITLVGRWITEIGPLWAAKFTALGRWITEIGPLWTAKFTAVERWITEIGPLWTAKFTAVERCITENGPLWADKLLPWDDGLGRCGPCVCLCVCVYVCVLGGGPETDIPFKNQDPTMTI